jgi:hypothetical protein
MTSILGGGAKLPQRKMASSAAVEHADPSGKPAGRPETMDWGGHEAVHASSRIS